MGNTAPRRNKNFPTLPTQGGNQTCRLQTTSWLKDYLHVSSYPSLSWPTPQLDQPCHQLLPCTCLNMSRLQQLKLQNFAVPGVCRQAGSMQTTLQIKGLSILYQGTRGEQLEAETFHAQACSVQCRNAPGTAAPSWKQGWREKKSFLTKRPETPILPQPWCSSSLNPCLFSCAKPSGHLSGACRRQLSAQQGRWQAGGTLRLLLLATGTLRWVQEGFTLQMSKVRWANRIPLLQSVAASTRQIL